MGLANDTQQASARAGLLLAPALAARSWPALLPGNAQSQCLQNISNIDRRAHTCTRLPLAQPRWYTCRPAASARGSHHDRGLQ